MQRVDDADHIDSVVAQGRTLVWAIETLDTVEPHDPLESAVTGFLQAAFERCLWTIVADVPDQVREQILSAGEPVRARRQTVPVNENHTGRSEAHKRRRRMSRPLFNVWQPPKAGIGVDGY